MREKNSTGKNNSNIKFIKSYSDDTDSQAKLWEIYEFIFNELKVGNDEPK
jgi:hypothetical protein